METAERRDENQQRWSTVGEDRRKTERVIKHLPKHPLRFLNKRTHPYIIKLILLNDIRFEIAFALPFKLYSTINYGAQLYSEPRYALWSSRRERERQPDSTGDVDSTWAQTPGSLARQRYTAAGRPDRKWGRRVSHPLSPVQGLW